MRIPQAIAAIRRRVQLSDAGHSSLAAAALFSASCSSSSRRRLGGAISADSSVEASWYSSRARKRCGRADWGNSFASLCSAFFALGLQGTASEFQGPNHC